MSLYFRSMTSYSFVIKDFIKFKQVSDVIVANKLTDDIQNVQGKVYTRDLFGND